MRKEEPMWTYNYTDELYHHGVKGMRWGVRRYQNEDGSLTPAGKRREQMTPEERSARRKKIAKGVAIGVGTTAAAAAAAAGGYALYRKMKNDPDKAIKDGIKTMAKNRHRMSDDELVAAIGRLTKEKQLKDLVDGDVSRGRSTVNKILLAAGTSAATTMATGGMLYTVKAALTRKLDPDDAAGYLAPKPKKK